MRHLRIAGALPKGLALAEEFDTIADRMHARLDSLTRAERQLADSILENYPVSGLGSITAVALNAGVSTPTVARMVQKLGYKGFPDFQAELRRELEAKITGPIAKHDTWASDAPEGHILNRFTEEKHPSILGKSTGKAVMVSALTTATGFGSLMLAEHAGIASLGKVMAMGAGLCMLAALTVLPAVLALIKRAGWKLSHGWISP